MLEDIHGKHLRFWEKCHDLPFVIRFPYLQLTIYVGVSKRCHLSIYSFFWFVFFLLLFCLFLYLLYTMCIILY